MVSALELLRWQDSCSHRCTVQKNWIVNVLAEYRFIMFDADEIMECLTAVGHLLTARTTRRERVLCACVYFNGV